MDKSSYIKVPIGADDEGNIERMEVRTFLVEYAHQRMFKKGSFRTMKVEDSQNKEYYIADFVSTSNKANIDNVFASWKNPYLPKFMYKNSGSYIYIDTPIIDNIGGKQLMSGFLLYNENGTLFLIAYKSCFTDVYLNYIRKVSPEKRDSIKPSMEIIYSELNYYLLHSVIPRLQKMNKLGNSPQEPGDNVSLT